ncbi:hypothetical protein GCM10029992_44890 [Glycomyces albus]
MTIRLGGPLVGALAGLAAAAVAAVLVAADTLWTTLAVAAGSVIVTAIVAAATGRSITPGPQTAPEAAPAPGTGATSGAIPVDQLAEPARGAQATADRTALVETCIWVRDRATSPALAAHLDQTFEKVGVHAIDATGQRFDPAVHEAGSTVAARAPAEDGIIARTETPGTPTAAGCCATRS